MKVWIVFVLIAIGPASLFSDAVAQTRHEVHIDEDYYHCLAKDTSYATLCDCAYQAYGKWYKEMERAYDLVYRKLGTEKDRQALKEAQEAWKVWRDAEFKGFDIFFNRPGSKWSNVRQNSRIDVVRTRANQLLDYLEALEDKKVF